MRRSVTVAAALLLVALLWLGARGAGPLPPLGGLLDPARGAWATVQSAELPADASAVLPGLREAVEVRYDARGVPHIFANNMADLHRALGYVVARDRLLQLDLQTLAGAGRLTEVAGARALPLDRQARQLGLPAGAERRFAALDSSSASHRAVAEFAEGVNAWIDQLTPATLPVEYRLLGRRPPRWQPVNSLYLLARMNYVLSYNDDELVRARTAALVGDSAAQALFPPHAPLVEPIIPRSRRRQVWEAPRIPDPQRPDAHALQRVAALSALAAAFGPAPPRTEAGGVLGSNNWAVAPERSATRHALLAGDPHLELTLPSIWYEVHLVVRDTLDVYGVTIPGAPGVLIGFNRDLAWTATNTGADVLDLYAEHVDDVAHPAHITVDGAARPLTMRVERYLGPHGELLATDTVPWSHRGPMRRAGDTWYSVRWTANEVSDELEAFNRGARARTAAEFLRAFELYRAPAQNFLVADRHGTIAIRSNGRIPVRPGAGRGDAIQDGGSARADWTGDVPIASLPTAVAPAQGFLASANQEPNDPRDEPRYLGANWAASWRALRINQLLRTDTSVTVDDMRRWQTDPGTAYADVFVPAILDAVAARERAGTASAAELEGARLLAQWDRRYTRENTRAVLFTSTMRRLEPLVWDELAAGGASGVPTPEPSTDVLAQLLRQPQSAWWDIRETPRVEGRDDVLARALVEGLTQAREAYGPPEEPGWRWSAVRHAEIAHLLRLGPLGRHGLPVQGGPEALNPSSGRGSHGASWRMVVELGPEVRAQAIYPGGQSGNPVSSRYADRLPRWLDGQLDSLVVPVTADAPRGTWVSLLHLGNGTR